MRNLVFYLSNLALVLILPLSARTEVLFEGYSKILSGGVQIGYMVNRYEFLAKEKKFIGTSFLKTGQLGNDVTESLKAVADADLNPISYEYRNIVGKEKKTIDATFSKGKMTAEVKTASGDEKPKVTTVRKDLSKGTFLSTFLVYLMLKSKTGIQTNTKFNYRAVFEEEADIFPGEAAVGKLEKYNGISAFKVLNTYKGDQKFVSYVSDRGEILATSSPATSLATELVPSPSLATANFPVPASNLKSLFGDVPMGVTNVLSRKSQLEAMPAPPPPKNPKQEGVRPGQGIIIKPQNPQDPQKSPRE